LVSLFIVIVSGLAGVVVIMRDLVRPLGKIERATRRISEGDYISIEGISSYNEIGKLQRAFNHMVQQIEKNQEELVQAGKLASLGTLTSGVAHELNNPLNNISMMAQTFTQVYGSMSEEERLELMARIDQQCERAKEVVDNLLNFSRVHPRTFAFSDIAQVIRESVKMVGNQLAVNNIAWEVKMPENLPAVRINSNRIKQVLVNILTNAIKAMPRGGRLVVAAALGDSDSHVDIAITDTGMGISPAVLPHIFDPFFTTSEVGQGTGLGLSVSYGILKRHGGAIAVKSTPGVGSTFTVRLPIMAKEATDGEKAKNPDC